MNIKTIISWLPELTLRTLRVLCIGFVIINVWSIYNDYSRLAANPLMPKYLAAHASFPRYFFIVFYLGIIFVIWKFIRGDYNSKKWWIPVLSVLLFEFSKFYIYGILMWINPYG